MIVAVVGLRLPLPPRLLLPPMVAEAEGAVAEPMPPLLLMSPR